MSDDWVRAPKGPMSPEPQSLASMCWYAGYVMLYRWKSCDPKDIWPTLDAEGIDLEDAKKSGLKLKDNKRAAMALGLNPVGYGQPVTVHNLKGLVKYSPVWATGQWIKGANHVYVIVGVSEEWTEYYDPWWVGTPSDAYSVKTVSTEWILQGDGKSMKGLAHTYQWFPLAYWKG